jgi:hypothetical protein
MNHFNIDKQIILHSDIIVDGPRVVVGRRKFLVLLLAILAGLANHAQGRP